MAEDEKPKNPNESESTGLVGIIKVHEYNSFVKWMSLPANMRGLDTKQLEELHMEDSDIELLSIKTHTEFAKRFGVSIDTLTDWKKKAAFQENMGDSVRKAIFEKFFARVAYAFTNQTIRHGDAARVQAWMQLFAGEPQGEITIETKITGANELTPDEIANMVSIRLKRTRGIDVIPVEDVEHEEMLPSEQEYDFEKIEKQHRDNGEVEVKDTNGTADDESKAKLRAALSKVNKNGKGKK